jgi:hypothetical protein
MVEAGGGEDELEQEAERIAAHHEARKDAWEATLSDMNAMAAELADQGWETVTVGAGDTAPEHPDAGEEGRWGLVYVVPGNQAADFRDVFEEGAFPEYNVYRSVAGNQVFIVTELRDPDSQTAIFVAGAFSRARSQPLVETARHEGRMYTHLQKLDGTHLGSFEHEGYQKFFPDA